MKKHTTRRDENKANVKEMVRASKKQRLTIGLDLGDETCAYCVLDEEGAVISRGTVGTRIRELRGLFGKMAGSRIALEVGTHSPWISRELTEMGHEVIVANARKVRLITHATRKNDRIDAEQLARLARVDPALLSPIRHRGEEAQADLAVIRARAAVVEIRTEAVNTVRGLVKPMGARLKKCDADVMGEDMAEGMTAEVKAVIGPLLKAIEQLTKTILEYDRQIETIATRYPERELLTQVSGVGTLVSLTFMLTLEDAQRFRTSREVGAFVGLAPKQRDSGERESQLGISKEGDALTRRMLVQAAHCVMRKGAPDCDLREWGRARQARGGKNSKKRAVVAVARKLAVLLHRLWVTGEVYDPLYNRKQRARVAAPVAA
jgi:transposase